MKKIISLDPGIARTGYAILEKQDNSVYPISYGCITTPVTTLLEKRLLKLYQELQKLIKKYQPELMVLEKLFFNKNQKTAITVGQAQGIMLLAAGSHNLKVEFVTPLQIKSALTGYGHADKQQVQRMVTLTLGLAKIPTPDDTADALACGITYLQQHQFQKYL